MSGHDRGETERGGGAGGDMISWLRSVPAFCSGIWLWWEEDGGCRGERSAATAGPHVEA
jgi:hypothetical protein